MHALSVFTESFFPFGEEAGDEELERGDSGSSQPIFFYSPFRFYGIEEEFIIV